jgi:glycosyltransferase involved in cell wall biosynthesis
LKILFVHNIYRQAGGEDAVTAAEVDLMRAHGHDVQLWKADNKDLPTGLRGKIKTALNTVYSTDSLLLARKKLQYFQPDIVHVHNFFPQISPSVYDACLELGIPVVQTLHNFRLICPGALLLRNGKVCELCIKGSPYQAARYGCYRDSKAGSLVVAHLVAQHRKLGTWQNKVNRFIALTDFAKHKFVEAGFPADKIAVKPNFLPNPDHNMSSAIRRQPGFALFVGRISQEKGIKTLLEAWSAINEDIELKVAGAGPLAELLPGNSKVIALGRQTKTQIEQLMQEAAFLVFPSEWYEGFPMVLLEAFAHGLPVLASRLGSMTDIIQDGENGLLFCPGNAEDLILKAKWLWQNPQQALRLGENARHSFMTKYTAEQNYLQLMAIYTDAKQQPLN